MAIESVAGPQLFAVCFSYGGDVMDACEGKGGRVAEELFECGEMHQETGSSVSWEGSGAARVRKNLIEGAILSLSEKSNCEKSSRFVII